MDLLLAGGLPLSPYLLGKLKRYLLERLAPRELKTTPLKLFEFEGMSDFLEYALFMNWVKSWLGYVKWYSLLSVDPSVPLEAFLDSPLVESIGMSDALIFY